MNSGLKIDYIGQEKRQNSKPGIISSSTVQVQFKLQSISSSIQALIQFKFNSNSVLLQIKISSSSFLVQCQVRSQSGQVQFRSHLVLVQFQWFICNQVVPLFISLKEFLNIFPFSSSLFTIQNHINTNTYTKKFRLYLKVHKK